jgi:hypothetical protein
MNKGQITDVHIKAGPEATVKDIQLHGTTVKRMQQYSGLSHHAQLLKDRWTGWRNQHGVPPVGTKGWEAQLELQKLPKIIEDRANRLAKGGLDEKSQLRLEAELSDLKHQMATHEKTFKAMDKDPGSGFVAAEGIRKNAARKQVMREENIPTSQQPVSQSRNQSGIEYRYEVPSPGGGTEMKSVQQQTLDSSHLGQGHWEAGSVKIDPLTGKIRMNKYDRPKLNNNKSKVNYDD